MTRIVTTIYRPKRPPRKRKAIALEVPVVTPGRGRANAVVSANRVEEPPLDRKPVIVRIKSRRASVFGDAPDMTAEEHRRRGDASVALWRELVRRATVEE